MGTTRIAPPRRAVAAADALAVRSAHRQGDGLARRESVRLRGGGHASSCSGRVGLLQRVLRQCFLLTSQWDLLRMEEQGLLRNMPALRSLGNLGRLHAFLCA